MLLWELFGVVFISLIGSLLHFTYEWSGEYKPLALVSAVNESTWEHLKIAFWPALIYSIIEYIPLAHITNNYIIAKAACLVAIPVLITIMFYTYTSLLGRNYLVIDILIFILAIFLGQMLSFKILTMPQLPHIYTFLGMLVIVILVMMFSLFTFFPPKHLIFKDPVKGGYGIQ